MRTGNFRNRFSGAGHRLMAGGAIFLPLFVDLPQFRGVLAHFGAPVPMSRMAVPATSPCQIGHRRAQREHEVFQPFHREQRFLHHIGTAHRKSPQQNLSLFMPRQSSIGGGRNSTNC
ncbi:MAG: hypothetical protein AB1513_03660 [Pseudomonadota bacterium]